MLNRLRPNNNESRTLAHELYRAMVERARAPVFYSGLGVADTIDGRFDLLSLHAWLVLEYLSDRAATAVAQALTDEIFVGFDEALRELGVSDMGAGRRLKAMADAFYGRLYAYGASKDHPELTEAILRNIYRGGDRRAAASTLATYVIAARSNLSEWTSTNGRQLFGPLPKA